MDPNKYRDINTNYRNSIAFVETKLLFSTWDIT